MANTNETAKALTLAAVHAIKFLAAKWERSETEILLALVDGNIQVRRNFDELMTAGVTALAAL